MKKSNEKKDPAILDAQKDIKNKAFERFGYWDTKHTKKFGNALLLSGKRKNRK